MEASENELEMKSCYSRYVRGAPLQNHCVFLCAFAFLRFIQYVRLMCGAGPDLCAVCAAYFIVMCKVMCGFYFKMQLCAVGMCDISKLCARLCAT